MQVEKRSLHVPPLTELCKVLQDGLEKNFSQVAVEVADCPDLTKEPWSLASPGICGRARILDVGGVGYLMPLPRMDKEYSFPSVATLAELPGASLIGAGAASHRVMKVNGELIPNLHLSKNVQRSHVATVDMARDPSCLLQEYPSQEFSLLVNLLATEGHCNDPVVHVRARCRTGPENLVDCMRNALAAHYGQQPVGLGGVFAVHTGTVYAHVMPCFSNEPLESDEKVDKWLKFYDVPAPVTCLSVMVSQDMGLGLRTEHTHFFSTLEHGWGGHYHHDLDRCMQEVDYEGYFVPAELVYRIDRPTA